MPLDRHFLLYADGALDNPLMTDDTMDDPVVEKHDVIERLKANSFFLVGSILYLPVSFWDLVAQEKDLPNPDQKKFYLFLWIAATGAYLLNGLLETKTAFATHKNRKAMGKTGRIGGIFNGLLFSFAATFELLHVIFGRNIILLSISAHVYVINALYTLWLGRKDGFSSRPDRMTKAGDFLFLLGASMDLTGTYLDIAGKLTNPAGYSMITTLAWFTDALLYFVANKISLDSHIEADVVQTEVPMKESKLSDVV